MRLWNGARSAKSAFGVSLPKRVVAISVVGSVVMLGMTIGAASPPSLGPELISISSSGSSGNANSKFPSVSYDGRFVAFVSDANDLIPGDQDPVGYYDVFVRDRSTNETRLVSHNPDGSHGGGNAPQISGNGRFVVFCSQSSNLVLGDTNGINDIFVFDVITDSMDRVTVSTTGEQADYSPGGIANSCVGGDNYSGDISADGRYVVFQSSATNLVPGDTNNGPDAFLRDRLAGTTELVSLAPAGGQFASGGSVPSVSDDGRFVIFEAGRNVYRRDRQSGTTQLVSKTPTGVPGNGDSYPSDLSADGRLVAFHSRSTNLVLEGSSTNQDIYLYDFSTDETTKVTESPDGATPGRMDPTGIFLTFGTSGSFLGDSNPPDSYQTYLYNAVTGETLQASVNAEGAGAANPYCPDDPFPHCSPQISQRPYGVTIDGEVIFESNATNLLDVDTDAFFDIYAVRPTLSTNTTPVIDAVALSVNPLAMGSSSVLSASVSGSESEVEVVEFSIDSGPAETMALLGSSATANIGTDLLAGVYQVDVRSRDVAGNWSDPSSVILVVYDPSGGFVTGGGWITPSGGSSDVGDLLPGLDGSSKANFGFNVKYQNGQATVPGGHLLFQYQVGDFRLVSGDFEWLVVTNSNWAKFRGVAEIDGMTGEFPFTVDARDGNNGQADRFVIKIWAPEDDPDLNGILYQASGDLDGGRIKIHPG